MEIISRKEAIEQELPRYFTGKPCVNGHVSERFTKKCDCVECNNERNAEYRSISSNKEKARIRSKEWRDSVGSDANYASVLASRVKNYGSNANYWRDYNGRTKQYHNERTLKWCRDHPEKKRNLSRQRKAMIRNAEGNHTAYDVALILEEQNFTCPYCNVDLANGYHVDHYIPLALGGSNWPDNLQCLCPTCNTSKGKKDPYEWHKSLWVFC